MSAVFIKAVNMSIAAGWLILAIVAVRLVFRRAPKWVMCLLWALVAIRLVCPFTVESALSLIPTGAAIPTEIVEVSQQPVESAVPVTETESVQPVKIVTAEPDQTSGLGHAGGLLPTLSAVWLAGIAVMLLYALISFLRLKKTVAASIPIGEGVMVCDEVDSPFILGVLRPIVYVPSSMTGLTLENVLRHERAHIKRRDHWWKPLGWLILSAYWFNPLCWLAYVLLCRDIEMACDEKVIRDMDRAGRAHYSQTLLDCGIRRGAIAACPLAFGEVGVKERVKSALNYKKPAFWVIVLSLAVCVIAAVCFLTNPITGQREFPMTGQNVSELDTDMIVSKITEIEKPEDGTYQGDGSEVIDIFYGVNEKVIENAGSLAAIKSVPADRVGGEGFLDGCVNHYQLLLSSVRYLPTYFFDTREKLEKFIERYGGGSSTGEASFSDSLMDYDDGFFTDNSLMMVFVQSSRGSMCYEVECLEKQGNGYVLNVLQYNRPELYSKTVSETAFLVPIAKSRIDTVAYFTAKVSGIVDPIGDLLYNTMMTTPETRSDPEACLAAHEEEHRELLALGDDLLRYIFAEFLIAEEYGGHTGLQGTVMRLLLDELAPEDKLTVQAENGGDYFREWQANAVSLRERYGDEWVKENHPAAYILLSMMG